MANRKKTSGKKRAKKGTGRARAKKRSPPRKTRGDVPNPPDVL